VHLDAILGWSGVLRGLVRRCLALSRLPPHSRYLLHFARHDDALPQGLSLDASWHRGSAWARRMLLAAADNITNHTRHLLSTDARTHRRCFTIFFSLVASASLYRFTLVASYMDSRIARHWVRRRFASGMGQGGPVSVRRYHLLLDIMVAMTWTIWVGDMLYLDVLHVGEAFMS
jgi:hypothetical protein